MIFEISVQKYTKNVILYLKIFPSKFSPYSPSAFYFLILDLYPPTGQNFDVKYFGRKSKAFGVFLDADSEYDTYFP